MLLPTASVKYRFVQFSSWSGQSKHWWEISCLVHCCMLAKCNFAYHLLEKQMSFYFVSINRTFLSPFHSMIITVNLQVCLLVQPSICSYKETVIFYVWKILLFNSVTRTKLYLFINSLDLREKSGDFYFFYNQTGFLIYYCQNHLLPHIVF